MKPSISIIIPTLNESEKIGSLVRFFARVGEGIVTDIIIVDGGSHDDTISIARQAGAKALQTKKPGRALQMNEGARCIANKKTSNISKESAINDSQSENSTHYLRFVHADVLPPESCITDLLEAIQQGYTAGCFMTRYDTQNPALLKTTTNRTKHDHWIFRMGGQTLRVREQDFWRLGGYDESMIVCEEVDLFRKLYKDPQTNFKNIKKEILVSARKHEINGVHWTNFIYLCIYIMYRLSFSQQNMIKFYTRTIKSERLAEAQEYTN